MITQRINLNLIPGQVLPRFNVSQYDKGSRTLEFILFNGNQSFTLTSEMTAQIQGTKADMHAFEYNATIDLENQKVVADLNQQMTAAKGDVTCELVLFQGSQRLGTCNFIIAVEPAALGDDAIISDSELPDIIAEATAQMEAAAASALESEGYAKGTQDGDPVESGSPYYQDNSKYYKEQAADSATTASTKAGEAADSATSASTQALKAEGYAVGKQNGTDVTSGSPYFENNAKYYADQADASADRAETFSVNVPYIGANGNWWVWNTTQEAYVDTGVDASITVEIADITMLAPDATPYVTNTGTDTDPIFHLFIPRGKGISGITKTSTSGLTDTYTITYSDGTTTTFQVVNGRGVASITKTGTSGLVDTYTIAYNDSTSDTFTVTNGKGIVSLTKTSTVGLVDTYTIVYNDGPDYTFTVTNGKTAYQSAVEGGYPGTEQEFEDDLANFESYKTAAVNAASDAADSAVSANQSYLDAKNEADRAQMYADFIEPHFIIQNNRLYIKDDAVGEFIVANNRLYMKLIA